MKNSILLFIFSLSLFSCKKENMDDCFTSTGKESSEVRTLDAFTQIEVYDNFEIIYTQSNTNAVTITAGENLLESIRTEVNDGILIIENQNTCNWVRNLKKKITIELFSTDLSAITYYGSKSLTFTNQLVTDTLLVNLWQASGDLQLNTKTKYLELKSHTGTGTITCQGETDELVLYIAGNGFIDALQTPARKALVVNENTGVLKTNVSREMKVSLNGSGNIEYLGRPTIDLSRLGSGKLIDLNSL